MKTQFLYYTALLLAIMGVGFAKNVSPVKVVDGKKHLDIEPSKFEKRDAKRVVLDLAAIAGAGKDWDTIKWKRSFTEQKELQDEGALSIKHSPLTTSISLNPETSIFYDYCKNVVPLYDYLNDFENDTDEEGVTDLGRAKDAEHGRSDYQFLVFAPTNEAVQRLSKKPWEFPIDIDRLENENAEEKVIQDSIEENSNRFVYEHVVLLNAQDNDHQLPQNAEKLLKDNYLQLTTLAGEKINLVHDSTQPASFYVKSLRSKSKHIRVLEYGCYRNGCVFVTDSCLIEF
ncbi:hypothetical protein ACO0QE_000618 [Hanseniaspora vineae]